MMGQPPIPMYPTDPCPTCNGARIILDIQANKPRECPKCHGRGYIKRPVGGRAFARQVA
jgi:DnaJ-class molecular chaperone